MLNRETTASGQHHLPADMTVIPRDQHNISRKNISENALKVLYRLNKAGYEAYLVGGSVRDLLLGKKPKDFDIATSATPDEVRKLFRNCRLVGRRFRLAHVMFGAEIIEVATFRGHHDEPDDSKTAHTGHNGMLLRDNIFGTIEEDAQRRDFTINSLYYSVADFSVRDYVAGTADLRDGVIRLVGDPQTRYREDPVRMLRAVRFAAKLSMTIPPQTAEPIARLAGLLKAVPSARLFEEALKLLLAGHGFVTWKLLHQYGLSEYLFPALTPFLTAEDNSLTGRMLEQALKNTDERLGNGLSVNPAFLFAAMFWYPQQQAALSLVSQEEPGIYEAFARTINNTLHNACRALAIPKRITLIMRDIWLLQIRLSHCQGKRARRLLEHEKFRAAYDLLVLRAQVENSHNLNRLQQWWQTFQQSAPEQQDTLISQTATPQTTRHRRQRSRRASPRHKEE